MCNANAAKCCGASIKCSAFHLHSVCSAVRFYILLFHRSRDGFQYEIASNVEALLLMFGDSQGIPSAAFTPLHTLNTNLNLWFSTWHTHTRTYTQSFHREANQCINAFISGKYANWRDPLRHNSSTAQLCGNWIIKWKQNGDAQHLLLFDEWQLKLIMHMK